MKKAVFVFAVVCILLVSCRPAYIRHGVKDIHAERIRLEDSRAMFTVLDTGQVHGIYKAYLAEIDSINTYFKDQYSESAWQLMTQYGQLKKPLKTYFEQYSNIQKDYDYSILQLSNLEYDLREKNISNEQYDIYFKSEREAIDQLIMKSNLISENAVRNVNRFNDLTPKMDSLIVVFKAGMKK